MMSEPTTLTGSRVSTMAAGLIGSEILKIAADIRLMISEGHKICNLTVGDFNSAYFPIPSFLREEIERALDAGETNYPPSDGMLTLRKAVQEFYADRLGLEYPLESILITGGSRPGIYGAYRTVMDPGDAVVYPVPSWNNNHYAHQVGAEKREVATTLEDHFLPTRATLQDAVQGARMLAICSPLNPTGTAFSRETLSGICDLVLEENNNRDGDRPLFVLYDQVYWMLTFGDTVHHDPVSLRPELRDTTIFIDGMSKAFAATGVRVGWVVAPPDVAKPMSSILGHVGAWAPRAEQVAAARLLSNDPVIRAYHTHMIAELKARLDLLYDGIQEIRESGHPVNAIPAMGAIYFTARFDLIGMKTPTGTVLATNEDIRRYLLQSAQLAIVPFQAFGVAADDGWFRLSVGAVSMNEIEDMLPRLRDAIAILV
jgi:aspartate aminotransferase